MPVTVEPRGNSREGIGELSQQCWATEPCRHGLVRLWAPTGKNERPMGGWKRRLEDPEIP